MSLDLLKNSCLLPVVCCLQEKEMELSLKLKGPSGYVEAQAYIEYKGSLACERVVRRLICAEAPVAQAGVNIYIVPGLVAG